MKLTELRPPKYGVTEKKKAELDALSQKVLAAQQEVEELQAIVNSLTAKSGKYNTELSQAENTMQQCLANKDSINSIVNSAKDLMDNSETAFSEVVLADEKTKKMAERVNEVMNKLIFSAEKINKLSNLIVRKKALNPLISDDLVSMVTKAGTDANNAVALTLVALKSVFVAQSSSMQAESSAVMEYATAGKLYEVLTGTNVDGVPNAYEKTNIVALLNEAYAEAKKNYKKAKVANNEVIDQLNQATASLTKAKVKLKSLESGLAAANAAALAS